MTQPFDSRAAGLDALWSDMTEAPLPRTGECAAMLEHLDLFVNDELNGLDVRFRHPQRWQHLQVCTDCRVEHDSLMLMLMAEAQGQLRPLPPRRIVAQAAAGEPWRVVVEPLPGRPRSALLFIFAPAYLQRSLQGLRPAAGRRDESGAPSHDALLLSYFDEAPGRETVVQVYARPAGGAEAQCIVAVVAVGEPMPATAVLTWDGRRWEQPLGQDGEAEFGPLPLAPLAQKPARSEAFSLRLFS